MESTMMETRRQTDITHVFAWRPSNFDRHPSPVRMARPKTGLKTGLKAVGQAVSRAQFVNVPSLGTPVNYTSWLTRLLNTSYNQRAAKRCVKSDIDELSHEQARKQFKNQNELLQKALAEVNFAFDGI
jgi:hypothetical protein